MKLVIADTGPLIHSHQADALDLLPMLGEVVVTPQVIRGWHRLLQPVCEALETQS